MDFRAILAGISFALIWSSAFTSARIIVTNAPPLTVSAIRFLVAGIIAVAIARALGQTWKLTPQQWRLTIVFGICQNALYLGLNFIAMQTVEASLAAIIASSLPLLVALFGWLITGDKVRPLGIAGISAGRGFECSTTGFWLTTRSSTCRPSTTSRCARVHSKRSSGSRLKP